MDMRNVIEDFGITVYDRVLLFDGRKYTEIRYYDWHTFYPLTDNECYDVERAIPADSVYVAYACVKNGTRQFTVEPAAWYDLRSDKDKRELSEYLKPFLKKRETHKHDNPASYILYGDKELTRRARYDVEYCERKGF